MGYIKRPEEESVYFYYKPVYVIDGADNLGKLVKRSKIVWNEKIILARNIS